METTMSEQEVMQEISQLKAQLTGNIFEDGEVQQKIYELKKALRPEIETNPELDDFDDEDCLYCGS
jgi:DNA-binding winged helix-turn-helix (wHTH) protein